MKKNKPGRKEEDVAAVLAGKQKCSYCAGTGRRWYSRYEHPPKSGKCVVCCGERWLKPSKITVLHHADGIIGSTEFVDD
jgi:hypothetical protein